MHDEYAMEMAKMAQQLKLNSLAFHDVLRQDQQARLINIELTGSH
jgi:hypothetical protein